MREIEATTRPRPDAGPADFLRLQTTLADVHRDPCAMALQHSFDAATAADSAFIEGPGPSKSGSRAGRTS